MPELPEVEISARSIRAWAVGHRIVRCEADPKARRMFRPDTPGAIESTCTGARVIGVERHGKQLLITLAPKGRPRARVGLLAHLGMSGKWVRRAAGETVMSSRLRWHLDDGSVVHDRDPRMFGRVRIVPDARFEEVEDLLALGPDPLRHGIDREMWRERFGATKRPIKVVLLDQRVAAGVGNIQAIEALFRAGIDPRRKAATLTRTEIRRLADAVLASIRDTLASHEGSEISYVEEAGAPNPFVVYGRARARCPRCKLGTIRRIVQAQRSTYFCPRCQT
jgi:formamidopyrimidine-DNA glycosylase